MFKETESVFQDRAPTSPQSSDALRTVCHGLQATGFWQGGSLTAAKSQIARHMDTAETEGCTLSAKNIHLLGQK